MIDASRFDQHVSKPLLEWEHSIYRKFYPGDKELAALLKCQLKTHGSISCPDGFIKYTACSRCSGDYNTALGNCLLVIGIVVNVLKELHVKADIVDNGDDCLLITERGNEAALCAAIPEVFGRMGFVMKIEPVVSEMEKIEFCQTHPVWDGSRWRMVRNVIASMSKDATITHHLGIAYTLQSHLRTIGEGGLSLVSGIPIMQEYYCAMLRAGGNAKVIQGYLRNTGLDSHSTVSPKWTPVTCEARASFAMAFGIMPDAQLAAEEELRCRDVRPVEGAESGPALQL